MTVEELGQRMSLDEFRRWSDHDETYHSDAWQIGALICSTIANMFVGKGQPRAKASDYLPDRTPKTEVAPSHGSLKTKFRSFAARHNAKVMAQQ